MNASEESILTQTLALLPPLLIFGRTKCFDTDVINGTGIDTAQYNDFVMPMYSLIEYSDNYSKTWRSLWQYFKDKPDNNLAGSESFKSKIKITRKTPIDGNTKDIEIIVPLKYLSNLLT